MREYYQVPHGKGLRRVSGMVKAALFQCLYHFLWRRLAIWSLGLVIPTGILGLYACNLARQLLRCLSDTGAAIRSCDTNGNSCAVKYGLPKHG